MTKHSSSSITARATIGALLVICSLSLLYTISLFGASQGNHKAKSPLIAPNAPTPATGSVGPAPRGPSAAWQEGTPASAVGPNVNMESSCVENVTCETFTLTVLGTQSNWSGQRVQVQLNWGNSANEYDIYIHQGANTNTSGMGANSGPLVTSAANGPGLTNQTAFIDVAQWGTGVFTVHVAYDLTPVATDLYSGTAMAVPETPAPPPPAPQDTGPKIGYENFEAPGILVPGSATSSGAVTVEYMGRGAGEPSIGVNWLSTSSSVGGMTNFQSDLETEFVSWDESCSPTIPKATWVDRRAPTSMFIDSDPIGFTDRQTGRVFAGELTLLSPTCKTSYTNDDGVTWVPSQGSGLASAVDHETIGGGPYHAPLVPLPSPAYQHAVYYCSQDIAAALCSRSDDGGLTFGPSIPIYNLTACGGLHGHVKVGPDGTVYVPNRGCGTDAAVIVSTDNGTTWSVRQVQNGSVTNTATSDDPAVAIDSGCPACANALADPGRLYYLGAMNGTAAMVATSTDQGQTWSNIYNVGAIYGVNNVAFPAAVAGDSGRAAVAFYGATGGTGDSSADGFTGVWHLYVAHTFDGGAHWTTTDATPTLPMQRMGLLRGGGGPMDRNLLDFFDVTIDRDGRVQVGYVNGCSGGPCSQAPVNADGSTSVTGNAYTATASIARQSSGRRMIAAKDPTTSTAVPGMPFVTETRIGNLVHLAWNESDSGNSMINNYQILRSTSPGAEVLITTVAGTQTGGTYTDTTATDASKTYYYKIVATNSIGFSCANNEIAAPYVGDTCSGVIIHQNLPTHPESTGGTASQPPLPQYLIDYIAVGEPPSTNELMFKMKVGNLTTVPPNSRWRMVWNSVASPDEQFYVGMTTDQNSNVSFEYGTVATQVVGLVLGVPTENPLGTPDAGSNFNTDGTITIYIDKSKVGSPHPGDLLGAVNGRTFNTGDTPPQTLERSTALVDHTFVKGNTDNSYPTATYTVVGNTICSSTSIEPVSAVSRKTHDSAGAFDVDLPLTGKPGIECRNQSGGAPDNETVIITFTVPVTVTNVTVTPGAGGTASVAPSNGFSVNNTQVTVHLTNVSNAQTLSINLIGVTGGGHSGNVSIPMSVLLGDVNQTGSVDGNDVAAVQSQTRQPVNTTTFRSDVNTIGGIDGNDVAITQAHTRTNLP